MLLARAVRNRHLQPTGTWPSGKAGDCKSLTPGSNPGVPFDTPQPNWRY